MTYLMWIFSKKKQFLFSSYLSFYVNLLVCGCDGNAYVNPCFAEQARVSISYRGECNVTEECSTDSDCSSNQICQKDVGTCTDNFIVGLCLEKPQHCFKIYDPVCGCNNVTYENDCYAFGSGINIAYSGECGH